MAMPTPPPRTFGRYELLERIAAGGMAEIYKAAYSGEGEFRKVCAIKRVLPGLAEDDEFVRMFREEAALTVRLSHANVVHVFDFGKVGNDYFLAMEYVRGTSLRGILNRCRERGERIPVKLALFIAQESAKGLGHAHSRKDDQGAPLGIIHRDVSPSNILVSWEGEVKITDFGIAKMASRVSHTAEGMVRGKASYLAPEQASGQPIDARADLFALGIVLWEAIAGKKLFEGDSPTETLARVMAAEIPSLTTVVPTLPAPIDAVVMSLLAREPDRRLPDAVAVERAIGSLLAKLGGATSADLAAFLAERFATEIAAPDPSGSSVAVMPRTSMTPSPHAAAAGAPAPLAPSVWDDVNVPEVERLDDDARRAMFDLPERRAPPPPVTPPIEAPVARPLDVQAPAASLEEAAPRTPAPSGASHFLDLDTSHLPNAAISDLPVIARVRAGGMLVHVERAAAVGALAMAVMIAAMKIVYRY